MEFRIGNEGTLRRASPSFYDGSHRLLSTSGRPFFRSFFTVLSNPLKPLQELDHTPTVLPGAILVRHPSRFPFPLSPLSSNRFGGPSRPPPANADWSPVRDGGLASSPFSSRNATFFRLGTCSRNAATDRVGRRANDTNAKHETPLSGCDRARRSRRKVRPPDL